jgi:hypothetical protein
VVNSVQKQTLLQIRWHEPNTPTWYICNNTETTGVDFDGKNYAKIPFTIDNLIPSRLSTGNANYRLTFPIRSKRDQSRFTTDTAFDASRNSSYFRKAVIQITVVTVPVEEGYFAYSEEMGFYTVRSAKISDALHLNLQNSHDAFTARIPSIHHRNHVA